MLNPLLDTLPPRRSVKSNTGFDALIAFPSGSQPPYFAISFLFDVGELNTSRKRYNHSDSLV
jgi:hypothetical protein